MHQTLIKTISSTNVGKVRYIDPVSGSLSLNDTAVPNGTRIMFDGNCATSIGTMYTIPAGALVAVQLVVGTHQIQYALAETASEIQGSLLPQL